MTERIRQIHVMSDCTYGRARVQAELRDMGLSVNHKRIERLMKLASLQGVSRRRGYVVTTQRDRQAKAAPDLVKRQFTATHINQLWVADMTYVPTWVGFLYLAVVVDVYSRKVVGWAFGERMTSDLVIAALNMALHTRRPGSVIHHSDQGSQYTSVAFGKRCEEMGVKPSMGTVGDAYDNAIAAHKHPTRNRAMFLMTTNCGMRVGAVAALRLCDVLTSEGKIRESIYLRPEQTKGSKGHTVVLSEKMQAELHNYLCSRFKLKDLLAVTLTDTTRALFTNQKNPHRGFSANTMAQFFTVLYARVGIDGASSHSGRRSFITNLANKGVSVRVLMELANHSSMAVTQKYIEVNPTIMRSAVELL